MGDVGGFSLNYHKHIHTGEGGILVTDDDVLADRLRLIRNHAEAVVGDMGVTNIANMIGYNFRLGEIECAIGISQLDKLADLVASRQRIAKRLSEGLSELPGLKTPLVEEACTHSYYVYPLVLDVKQLGVSRTRILVALQAEGLDGLSNGYVNVHLLPMYQMKIAYGSNGFPWSSNLCKREVSYAKGICPVAEDLHDETFMGFPMCLHDLTEADTDLIIRAFKKVWANLGKIV